MAKLEWLESKSGLERDVVRWRMGPPLSRCGCEGDASSEKANLEARPLDG